MRDLIISLILFIIMIGIITGNAIFVLGGVDELIVAVESIPDINAADFDFSGISSVLIIIVNTHLIKIFVMSL